MAPLPETQRAWVHRSKGGVPHFTLETIPVPRPGPEEILLKVEAAGMCASDLHILDGTTPLPGEYVLGHEIVGTVAAIGSDLASEQYPEGLRLAVHGPNGCGKCANCKRGFDNQCQDPVKKWYGLGINGGYEEYVVVRPAAVVPVPSEVSSEAAAVTTDAVLSPYHAVKRGGIGPDTRVLIIGLGGLGMNGLQIASHFGAKVIATDLDTSKLAIAKQFGAQETFEQLPEEPLFVDVVLDFVGTKETFESAKKHASPLGKIVPVGLGATELSIVPHVSAIMEHQFIFSFWGTTGELAECLDLVAKGVIQPTVETCPLEDVKDRLHKLEKGGVKGRVVAMPSLK
uniref:ARAD1C32934p n=1 Tax=Blastobotrys adeninivorans TaxID=409370 RepID=A0A060T2K2_BLAAD